MRRTLAAVMLLLPALSRAQAPPARALRANQIHAEPVLSLGPLKSSRGATTFGSSSSEALSMEQAVNRALSQRPRLSAAAFDTAESREHVRRARAGFLPEVRFDAVATIGPGGSHGPLQATGLVASPYTRNFGAAVTIVQTIWDFGRTLYAYRANQSLLRVAGARQAVEAAAVALEVKLRFLACVGRAREVRIQQATADKRTLTLRLVRSLTAAKMRPELDARLAALRVSEAESDVVRARRAHGECLIALAHAMGEKAPPSVLREDPGEPVAPAELPPLIERALSSRPEIAVAERALAAARARGLAEESGHLPVLRAYATGGVARWNNAITDDSYAAAGIALSVPLFSGYAIDAAVHAARARASRLRAELREERLRIRAEVAGAYERLQGALELVTRVRIEVEHAKKTAELARDRFRGGLLPLLDLQSAEILHTAAELRLAAARTEAQAANEALRYATGEPP
jgi:outer membrane protein TolC